MNRDPTLNIKLTSLVKALNEIKYTQRMSAQVLADYILKEAQPYQITGRHHEILALNAKTKKKVARSEEADTVPNSLVEKVNLFLVGIRKDKYPRARVKAIDKNNKQYLMLKEVTKMAWNFSEFFEVEPRIEGVREFMTIGLGFMSKYGLNKYKTYENKIHEYFESKIMVVQDIDKEGTREFYGEWQKCMVTYVGLEELISIDKDIQKYVHLVYAREQADLLGAEYLDWIEAQFEGLAFLNVIPNVYQFHGDNAKERYSKFIMNKTAEDSGDSAGSVLNMYN